jgi:hypothetical protein
MGIGINLIEMNSNKEQIKWNREMKKSDMSEEEIDKVVEEKLVAQKIKEIEEILNR